MASVLIVDDEANIRRMLAALLEADGHTTTAAGDAGEALAAVGSDEPDVVLLDLAMPGKSGIEVLDLLRAEHPLLPVVMMSGRATLSDAVRATKLGAFHFLEKPLSPEALLLAVNGAIELRRARELSRTVVAELAEGRAELVGSSALMQRVRALIERVAPTDARVLITGESGTGKELAAVLLHERSARAGRPFVRVNSAAIPRELVESEMFGRERGAFTGATDMRRGRFELADRGTLFLDEIADLSTEAQSKLLRAIELGHVERVGGQRPIHVDVRVIAATNRDLVAELETGRFREDLYYRLDVLRIHMPALRERLEDVPELVDRFLARFRARDGLATPRLSAAALRRLMEYDWPGNVRELANVCERIAILHAGRDVQEADVAGMLASTVRAAPAEDALSLPERLDAFERGIIARSIAAAGGNVAVAARRLRTDRANLYRRMRRLGIDR
jgi:two-component system nitrogen regulation response regulator NtrX